MNEWQETENGKMTRQERKQRHLYFFKMTDKTEVLICHRLEHIVVVCLSLTDLNTRMNIWSITVILEWKTKFSTTPNSKEVSINKRDIHGQPKIAVAIQTGTTYTCDR